MINTTTIQIGTSWTPIMWGPVAGVFLFEATPEVCLFAINSATRYLARITNRSTTAPASVWYGLTWYEGPLSNEV